MFGGATKEQVYNMNLSLGEETDLDTLPLDLNDLSQDTQQAYNAWQYLKPDIDSMTGVILGRNMADFKPMCEALDIKVTPTLTRLAATINNAWNVEAQRLADQKSKQSKKGKK